MFAVQTEGSISSEIHSGPNQRGVVRVYQVHKRCETHTKYRSCLRIKADGNVVAVITRLTVLSCVGKTGPRELAFSALLSFKKLRPTSSDKTD